MNNSEILKIWNESHTRFRLIRVVDGMHEEITPICCHRNKRPVPGSLDTFHCNKRPEVVHCSGQAVGCQSYFNPDNCEWQLELDW